MLGEQRTKVREGRCVQWEGSPQPMTRQGVATAAEVDLTPPLRTAAKTASIPWRRLVNGGILIVAGAGGANVLSFLFSYFTAHLLLPADYATVTACLSLFVVVAVPAGTLQLVAAKYAAEWEHEPGQVAALRAVLVRIALTLGITIGTVVFAVSGRIATFLQISSPLPVWIIAAVLALSFVSPVYRGLLQGFHLFGRFAVSNVVEYLTRVVLAVVLIVGGLKEIGALGAILCGVIAGAALAWWLLREHTRGVQRVAFPQRDLVRAFIPTLLMQFALTAMLFIDTLLAKHFFPPALAGLYAGLATVARILFYLPGALTTFLFPVVARLQHDHAQRRVVSNITLAIVALADLVLLIIYMLFPHEVILVVVGAKYLSDSPYLVLLSVALGAYAVVSLIANYLLATNNRLFVIPLLLAPAAEVLLMTLFHSSLKQFVATLDAVMLSMLVCMLVLYFRSGGTAPQTKHEARDGT
ncbi:MAG: oligosaccharide flippase family protein [Chloroflexi bacterium]|nr:oligosaccharide flippase family protein [Chloroflexota bacterium]